MVTKPNRPVPPTHEGMDLSRKQEPATVVSGMPGIGKPVKSGPLYRDAAPPSDFKLPETISPKEIQEQSFRYGGGRSAGKLSTKP